MHILFGQLVNSIVSCCCNQCPHTRHFLHPQPEHKPSHAFGIKHSPYLGSLKGDAWGGKTVVVESGRGINSAAIAALKTSSATTNGHAAAATNGHSR